MQFEEDDMSGNLIATGNRGEYLLYTQLWTGVDLTTFDAAGPNTERLGAFNNLEDAKQFCNTFDNMTEEELR